MSRRKSSILLPFNSTASKADNQTGNVSRVRNRKTPAKRRRTQVEVLEPGLDENNLEFYDGKQNLSCPLTYLLIYPNIL